MSALESSKNALAAADETNLRLTLRTDKEIRSFGLGFLASILSLLIKYPRGRDVDHLVSSAIADLSNRIIAVRRRDHEFPSNGFVPGRFIHLFRKALNDELKLHIELDEAKSILEEEKRPRLNEPPRSPVRPQFDMSSVLRFIDEDVTTRLEIESGAIVLQDSELMVDDGSITHSVLHTAELSNEDDSVELSVHLDDKSSVHGELVEHEHEICDKNSDSDSDSNSGSVPTHGQIQEKQDGLTELCFAMKPIPVMSGNLDSLSAKLPEWDSLLTPVRAPKNIEIEPLKYVLPGKHKMAKSNFYETKLKNAFKLVEMRSNKRRMLTSMYIINSLIERRRVRMSVATKVSSYFAKRRMFNLWELGVYRSQRSMDSCTANVKALCELYVLERYTGLWRKEFKISQNRRALTLARIYTVFKSWIFFTKLRYFSAHEYFDI